MDRFMKRNNTSAAWVVGQFQRSTDQLSKVKKRLPWLFSEWKLLTAHFWMINRKNQLIWSGRRNDKYIFPCGYFKSEKSTFRVNGKTFKTLKYVSQLLKALNWMRIWKNKLIWIVRWTDNYNFAPQVVGQFSKVTLRLRKDLNVSFMNHNCWVLICGW